MRPDRTSVWAGLVDDMMIWVEKCLLLLDDCLTSFEDFGQIETDIEATYRGWFAGRESMAHGCQ